MKTCIHFLSGLLVVLSLFFSTSLLAQADALAPESASLKYTDLPGPEVEFTYELPALTKIEGFDSKTPYYRHLFIFGDGNFRMDTSQLLTYKTVHPYNRLFSQFLTNYYARSYSTGIYSDDGDEPPRYQVGPIPAPDTGNISFTQVVEANRYLKITRNVEVKPGDPFVTIISVKNPQARIPLRGQLFFFYNGQMREVSKLKPTSSLQPVSSRAVLPFSEFSVKEVFHYFPEAAGSDAFHFNNFTAAKNLYENVLAININAIPPGQEIHFFLEMEGDEDLNKLFDAKTKVEMDFLAVLGATDNPQESPFTPSTPDNLSNKLQQAGIDTLLPQLAQTSIDSAHLYQVQEDNTSIDYDLTAGLAGSTNRILDAYESTATLVNVHDPNFLLMESCACQENQDRYQIFATVQCENEGYGTTSKVLIDMKLPTGITADDVVVTPLSYHPPQATASNISLIKLTEDSVRWQWNNLGLEGTAVHGVGDPRTYAQLQFHLYSSIRPELLPPMQACIRFEGPEHQEVCTESVLINLLTEAADLPEALNCQVGECSDDPNATSPTGWPWWVWLLLILFLLILLVLILRRR